ncbi:MAG TPA: M1 family metallopeptidase [Anaerolineales bacterium]|nr:M1 family metallopeptidase [Anaerolineales bacterium]
MRWTCASFLSLSLLAVSCSFSPPRANPVSAPTESPLLDPLKKPWDDRTIFKEGLITSAQSTLEDLHGASVYHIELTIADDLMHVTGTEEVRYTNTENIPLEEIQLRLFPNILGGEMTISTLTVNGQSTSPTYQLNNSLMIVPLATPLQPGESVILQMDFSVTVPQSIEMNYGVFAYYDDVLTLAHAYPMIAVYDDEGWNAEIPSPNGDVIYADASFYIVRVHAPKDLTVVTSGQRIHLDETDQAQAWIVASGPARDFYLAASRTYEVTSQTFGEVTLHSYAPKELQSGSQTALEIASKAIEVFSARYAPYPYTELDIVATPTLALGVEYPGIIAITSRLYEGSLDNLLLESTVAHEVGHQWFYNLIGNDQLDDPWLDEALTQFATLQYYADEHGFTGEEMFRATLRSRWAQIGMEEIPIGLPVAEYQNGEYGAIVYGRGPLFFEALRQEMGSAAFDAFLQDYVQTFSWKIATPEALHSLAEQTCTCNLDTLFEEWVYP